MKSRIVYLTLLFFCGKVIIAQNNLGGFVGFGTMPVKTPDSLLQKFSNAQSVADKASAAGALASFHASHGTTDSVVHYALPTIQNVKSSSLTNQEKNTTLSKLYYLLAKAYNEKGLFDEALRYYLQGIKTAEDLNNVTAVQNNMMGIADVHYARKEYAKALTGYNKLLAITKDENLRHHVYKQLGNVYLQQNNLVNAKQNFEKALSYFKSTTQLKEALETKLNLGVIAELSKNTNEANAIYDEVKNIAQQNQFYDIYINAGQRLGDLFVAKKDYESAKILLSMVYLNSIQWGNLEAQQKVLNSLRNLHATTGDFKNAYALMTQYLGVSEQILEKQNKKEINELEIKYNTLQKEKEILSKENELGRQKTIKYSLLIGFLVVLIPVIALLYVYYQKLQAQSKLNATMVEMNEQKITALLKDKELELLKASIGGQEKERKRIAEELHDSIGGNLAAIKLRLANYDSSGDLSAVMKQVDDTYVQVRDLSHDLVPQKFNNAAYTELIAAYCKQFNVPGKTNVSFQAYPQDAINAIDTPLKVELYKVVQELMTNAQKHAGASSIEIQLMLVDDVIKLIFEDDGKGFTVEATRYGIGFQNIRERLKLFRGSLSVDSFPSKGTVVDIEVPLKNVVYET